MESQTLTKQVITISRAKGVISTFEAIDIVAENEHECILSINNRFITMRQEGVVLGLKISMAGHQISDVRSSLNHTSKNEEDWVLTISRYTKNDNTDNASNGFFDKASDALLNFPAFSKFTISQKGRLIQRRGKRVHRLFRAA
jgi:hypothetical protein